MTQQTLMIEPAKQNDTIEGNDRTSQTKMANQKLMIERFKHERDTIQVIYRNSQTRHDKKTQTFWGTVYNFKM